MRNWSRKLIPALLALVVALAMGLPVLAAAPDDVAGQTTEAELAIVEAASEEPEPTPEPDIELPDGEPVPDVPAETAPLPDDSEPALPVEEPEAEEVEDDAGDETEEAEEAAEPYGLELSADSIVVSTWEELRRALGEDNTYTTVYLGADITAESSSAPIHAKKPFAVIDGSPPSGGRHTLTQYPASGTGGIILVDGTATSTAGVTLRNMDIAGNNDYGVVWVNNSITTVTITLENVNYTGPQALHHRSGTVRFIGGSYTLTSGELAEALHVELGGALSIDGPATGGNAVLWLASTSSTLRVLQNAEVRVNTKNYLVYGTIADVTMEPGAGLSLTSSWFGFSYAGDSVGAFTLADGASLEINLNTTESYAALRVANRFEMMPGSSAAIIRTGTAGIPLRLTAAGAQAVFNQPQRVFFYSSAGVPLRFTGAGTLSVTTAALNVWSKTSWPLAGGMHAQPTHIWNKTGGVPLTLTGTYYETTNRSLVHNLSGSDPVVSQLTSGTFNLEGSQLLAFGSAALDIDIPTTESPAITGTAAPGAELLATGTTGGAADTSGRYSLPLPGGALSAGDDVTVISRSNHLYIRQKQTVQDAGNHTLSFLSVPESIRFGALPVPDRQGTMVPLPNEFQITVQDSRPAQSPWRIDAMLESPMAADVNNTEAILPGTLLFESGDGGSLALNESPQTVYRHSGGTAGEISLAWENGGVALSMAPGTVFSGAEYTATINWALVDAP